MRREGPHRQRFRSRNDGDLTLTVSGLTDDSDQFSVSPVVPPSFNINGGDSSTVTVTFAPTSTGSKTGTLTITSNDATAPTKTVSLSGTGIDTTPPAAPSGLTAAVGNNQMALTWTANTDLDLSHYIIYRSNTAGFTPASPDSIARVDQPGTSYTNIGLTAGSFYFKIAAVDSTGNLSGASGEAAGSIAPVISISPSPLPFGDVQIGQSKPLSLSISNTGTDTLSVTGITVTGTDAAQFSVSSTTATIAAGPSAAVFTVTFTPTSAGAKSASLSIAHNAAGSPSSIALSGNGTTAPPPPVPVISLSTTNLAFGNVQVAQSNALSLSVSNTGNADLTVTGITVTGTDAAHFSVSPITSTVGRGATAVGDVYALYGGGKSASLSITHNAGGFLLGWADGKWNNHCSAARACHHAYPHDIDAGGHGCGDLLDRDIYARQHGQRGSFHHGDHGGWDGSGRISPFLRSRPQSLQGRRLRFLR